jgi:alpha-pyrone synthase
MKSYIHSISTQTPEYKYSMKEISAWMKGVFATNSHRKLDFIAQESLIEHKYSVLPDFKTDSKNSRLFSRYQPFLNPSTQQRMSRFKEESLKLGSMAAKKCLSRSAYEEGDITHFITVTCTGLSAPGPEIYLSHALGLDDNVEKYSINFMGCYAAFHALKLAKMIAKSNQDAKVLIVLTELCTLHFRNDDSNDNILSTMLFGDGAAAVVVSNEPGNHFELELQDFSSKLMPQGNDDMAWNIGDNGFEMVLNGNVPKHIHQGISEVFEAFTNDNEIDYFAVHPGGKNVLQAFADGLDIPLENLSHSFDVLKNYGNMSSPTVLFVLESIIEELVHEKKEKSTIYAAAFGPGLTIESALMSFSPRSNHKQSLLGLNQVISHA